MSIQWKSPHNSSTWSWSQPTSSFLPVAQATSWGSLTHVTYPLLHTWDHRHTRLASVNMIDKHEKACHPSHHFPESTVECFGFPAQIWTYDHHMKSWTLLNTCDNHESHKITVWVYTFINNNNQQSLKISTKWNHVWCVLITSENSWLNKASAQNPTSKAAVSGVSCVQMLVTQLKA